MPFSLHRARRLASEKGRVRPRFCAEDFHRLRRPSLAVVPITISTSTSTLCATVYSCYLRLPSLLGVEEEEERECVRARCGRQKASKQTKQANRAQHYSIEGSWLAAALRPSISTYLIVWFYLGAAELQASYSSTLLLQERPCFHPTRQASR